MMLHTKSCEREAFIVVARRRAPLMPASDLLARASFEKGNRALFPTLPEASRYPGLLTPRKSPVRAQAVVVAAGRSLERRGAS